MYHIKADKRVRRSAERMYEGLNRCLEAKSLKEITVSDVCKESKVGRATFYRNFDVVSDILSMKCDQCFKEVLEGFVEHNGDRPFDAKNLLKFYISYWSENWKIIDHIVKSNRIDIIYKCHLKNSLIIASKYNPNPHLSEAERRYLIAMRSGETISILSTWILGGRKETADELFNIVRKLLFPGQ
ncbi:TetR/AcrR family transcriptional regulator [Marinobacter salinisoli]|uniref:TetR/AcrR family transcriptional regulator n=1 Tax=Marinobacter salinisoli TaxID=2769486 RepID=A0ABX7MRJ2_9GAMM|nr:TetR/AcrR family transcriptional regulator [Marinobacter salinisoli]QSP94744.1 TetR/AcrR family transcriptional regulator [Marinobacter salinisoli]